MHRFLRPVFQQAAGLAYKAGGLNVLGTYRWLLSTAQWSADQRKRWRLSRLCNILEYCWSNVPFYREFWGDHGVSSARLKDLDELQRYPVLTKDIFRANADRVRPINLDSIPHIPKATGGTTGQPVQYTMDKEQWVLTEAFHLWGWTLAGYNFGDPVGVIAGGSLVPDRITFKSKARSFLQQRTFLFGVSMDRRRALEYHRLLADKKIEFLYGYPSVIYLFSKHLFEAGQKLPHLRAVVTTAEMLQRQYRDGIKNFLGVPVFDNLGCNDGGFESYECSLHRGLHYNDLQSVLEEDQPSTDRHTGRLLISNLWNKSTPFVRFENGDMVSLAKDACGCGRSFPLIAGVQGRTADILTFGNGQSLSGPALTLIFANMQLDGWQVVQTGEYSLEVRLCTDRSPRSEDVKHIQNVLRTYLDNEIAISIKPVKELRLTPAGKRKPIWREVQAT